MKLRSVLKRLLWSIAAGTAFQCLILLLVMILSSPVLAMIFLLPGWAVGLAGTDSDHSWTGLIVGSLMMLSVNNLFYAPAIYFLLWYREVRQEVRENDTDSFIKKLANGLKTQENE
jgi:hypothetical protein